MLTTTIKRLAPRGAPDETAFLPVASVTVDDGAVTLRGDLRALPLTRPLRDPKTREDVTLAEDPERWARLLRFALRSPELQIDVQADTAGPLEVTDETSPIAALRRLTGLSTRAAATEAGISQPAWTAAEKRGAGVSLDLLERYATALGGTAALQLRTDHAAVLWNIVSTTSNEQSPASELVSRRNRRAMQRNLARREASLRPQRAAGESKGEPSSTDDPAAYAVRPKSRGEGWVTQRAGAKRASSSHTTQAAALEAAKAKLQQAGGGEIRVHDVEGRLRDSVTVGTGSVAKRDSVQGRVTYKH